MASLTGAVAAGRRRARPPLWLAAATVAAADAALYSLGRWIYFFVTFPVHTDVRIDYVAAQAGLRYGWSRIYDIPTLRALSSGFPAVDRTIDATATYISPPLQAWLFVPLTLVPEPVAYAVWTAAMLAAMVWTWHVAAPFSGLPKIALLLLAVGLWPVMQTFYYGQPGVFVIALVALAWWLMRRDRPLAAGAALAVATFLKPQVVAMVPFTLLVAGAWRPVAGWAAACAVLGALSAINIGAAGIAGYWDALALVQADPGHAYFTVAQFVGLGVAAYALMAAQGLVCVAVAYVRRHEPEVVLATGLLGSLLVSVHLHQWDYTNLVLGAWLVLRTSPPLWHRLWLAVGIATMQALSLGFVLPQLVWNVVWLAMLASGGSALTAPASAPRRTGAPAAAEP